MTTLPKIPITVLVQTKNEEVGIASCLRSLGEFTEVIVVDSNSTDQTAAIARNLNVEVVNFTWNGQYPKKKQWQLDNVATKNDWILFIDADEKPTPRLLEELRHLEPTPHAAYDIKLDYVFDGKTLRHGHQVVKRALLRRTRAAFPVLDDVDAPGMGELEGHYQPTVRGTIGSLSGRLTHDDEDPVRTWFDRHNRYSDWESYLRHNPELRRSVARFRSPQGRVFDAIPGKALAFFAYAYLAKAGFLDGRAGFNYALALSFYYWQIALKARERARLSA